MRFWNKRVQNLAAQDSFKRMANIKSKELCMDECLGNSRCVGFVYKSYGECDLFDFTKELNDEPVDYLVTGVRCDQASPTEGNYETYPAGET